MMSISFLPVEIEPTSEFVARGPAVTPLTVAVVFVEKTLIVLNKDIHE